MAFLSLLDDRIRPRGSRDPLGFEPVWTGLGRKLVGNLTTVTRSLDNFMVGLLCCHFGYREGQSLAQTQQRFMRMEQLCGYLREEIGLTDGVLGANRIKKRSRNHKRQLGEEILSNQLSYGLWGLYSTAMAGSGWIQGPERKLTVSGTALVQLLVDELGAAWSAMTHLCEDLDKGYLTQQELEGPAQKLKRMLANQTLRESLIHQGLLRPSENNQHSIQLAFYQWLNANPALLTKGRRAILTALTHHQNARLAKIASDILATEPYLVLAMTVFSWLQGQQGEERSALASKLSAALADLYLPPLPQPSAFLRNLYQAVKVRSGESLLTLLLDENTALMKARGGGPWLDWEGERLKVLMRQEGRAKLDGLAKQVTEMDNSYFIDAFVAIAKQGGA